jgi:hypothetical protein
MDRFLKLSMDFSNVIYTYSIQVGFLNLDTVFKLYIEQGVS